MKNLRPCGHALSISVAAAILSACGGSQPIAPQLPGALGAAPSSVQQSALNVFRMRFQYGSGFRAPAMHVSGPAQRQRYKLRVLPTLGGPIFNAAQGINERGQVVGYSLLKGSTAVHVFLWQRGLMRDLGSLQGGPYATTYTNPNENGDVSGYSNTQMPDPNGEDFCISGNQLICLGFLWKNGKMIALPTLGGNNGQAYQVNDGDEIAGVAENSTFDSTCGSISELEAKPVVWRDGTIAQLPIPSGDVDGWGYGLNDRGEVVGASGGCFAGTLWPSTAVHILLWPKGARGPYTDLGNLGQAYWNTAFYISNSDEVVGMAGVPSDLFHAFLWTKKSGMKDLGTLPGDLVSWANNINSEHQVVGASFPPGSAPPRAFIWENGKMTDLNVLVGRHPRMYLSEAFGVNDRGWIAGGGNLPNGDWRPFLLYPCEESSKVRRASEGY